MIQAINQTKKYYVPKPVQRERKENGVYWVQSSRYKQLWYKVILRPAANEVYCACKDFKLSQQICKHIMKVMASEGKVV